MAHFFLPGQGQGIFCNGFKRFQTVNRKPGEHDFQEFVAQALSMLPAGPFDSDTWGAWTSAVKEATGRKGKALFMPLRKALTGLSHGPDMGALLPLLQKIPRD